MIQHIFLFLAGLALFLLGMVKLSEEMQRVFSSRIREYIRISVRKPFYGLIMGLTTTIFFQSSSATTLLTMGLVSAGLVSFYHSLGIILGADIGTTLTIQLVVWKVTDISPILLIVGICLYFAGKDRLKTIGEALLYFGTIFYGLSLIGQASAPLKDSPAFVSYFLSAQNPVLGFFIGLVFTAIVHASAIPISMLVMLGMQGLISIDNALPIIVGANVGTTATALMGSIASDINGKRTALAHLVFKCTGALVSLLLLAQFIGVLKMVSANIAQQVAIGHFLFNFVVVVMFIFFLAPFSRVILKILPGEQVVIPLWPEYLHTRYLSEPRQALACVRNELRRQIALSEKMCREALEQFIKFRTSKQRGVMYMEMVMDNLQVEITNYLWGISCGALSEPLTKLLFTYSSFAYDIERIGDRSVNLAELAEQKSKRKAHFTPAANEELRAIGTLVLENLNDAIKLVDEKNIEIIRVIMERERRIDVKIKNAIAAHLERFYTKMCIAEAGPIYVDVLVNLERISDHCRLIAQLTNELEQNVFDMADVSQNG